MTLVFHWEPFASQLQTSHPFTKIRKFNNAIIHQIHSLHSNPANCPNNVFYRLLPPHAHPHPDSRIQSRITRCIHLSNFYVLSSPLIRNPNVVLKTLSLWHQRTRTDRGRGRKHAKKKKKIPTCHGKLVSGGIPNVLLGFSRCSRNCIIRLKLRRQTGGGKGRLFWLQAFFQSQLPCPALITLSLSRKSFMEL